MPFQNDPYFSAREQTPAAFLHLLVYCYRNHLYFVPTLTGLGPLCYPHKTPFKNLCTPLCSLHTKPHTGTHSQTYRTVCTQLHTLTSHGNTPPRTRRRYKRETCLYVHTCRLALACLVVSVPKPAQCFCFQTFPSCHSVGPTGRQLGSSSGWPGSPQNTDSGQEEPSGSKAVPEAGRRY